MKLTKQRKLAGFTSLAAAVGNIGVIAITFNVAGRSEEFMTLILNSPQFIFILCVGLLTLITGIVLLTPVELSKKILLAVLLLSVVVFAIAAVQMSIVVLMVLLWPWSLYRLYRSETA